MADCAQQDRYEPWHGETGFSRHGRRGARRTHRLDQAQGDKAGILKTRAPAAFWAPRALAPPVLSGPA